MNNKLITNLIMILVIAMIIISSISSSVFAVTKKVIDSNLKGSVSLTAYEFVNGDENNKKVLKGAEFTIYSVTTNQNTVAEAESYIANNTVTSRTGETGADGNITFSNLDLGRYFVVETNAPKNVLTRVESFLVDIPSTNAAGTEWNYDIVVSPKNVTVYADVELTKTNNDGNMQGVTFKLQKFINNTWTDYELDSSLVTNNSGKIQIHNLEVGRYRLVEIASSTGYIVDSNNTQNFEVTLNNTDITLDMNNEKVDINKYVILSDGSDGKHLGANLKDTVKWKITSNVPSIIAKMNTYKITDTLSTGLDVVSSSIEVYGIKGTSRTKFNGNFTPTVNGQVMTITFNNTYLANFDNLEILYNTTLNNSIEYGKASTNKVAITYTDNIDIDGTEKHTYTTTPNADSTAEVHTGELLVKKTDGSSALSGAVFRIAETEADAKNGNYMTDKLGNVLESTSNDSGYVVFRGLAYGDDDISAESGERFYWLVEVQAPSYQDEDGNTKYYNLLQFPVKVKVSATSGTYSETATTKIVNKKGFVLPKTGAIGAIVSTLLGIGIIAFTFFFGKKRSLNEQEN